MALLTETQRRAFFKELGLGEYNEANVLKLQKRYLQRKADHDGKYGQITDNLLRTLKNVHDFCGKNFVAEEFRCGCNGRFCSGYPTFMRASELKNIQSIRTHFGKPMIVTCGLRCSGYNHEVGGIPGSLHKEGRAVDFYIEGVTDTLGNRKKNIGWISKLPNHHYTYGDGIFAETADGKTETGYVSAGGMGNCLHTDSYFAVVTNPSQGGEPKPTPAPTLKPTATKYKAIDVSSWQGDIDWKKVKADGVVAAIIRYADGTTIDSKFAKNMKEAKANGLHIGAYIFSRAKTKAEAESEATRIFNAVKPYSPDMPLYIDLEDTSLKSYANTVAKAYIDKIKALGGFAGVYANLNWWNNYLTKVTPPARWVAQYYSKCEYKGSYGMWQYTSDGKINGISGRVDMDWLYVDYWNKIKPTPGPKGYTGKFPEYKLVKTNAKVKSDAVKWAKWIAGYNLFHYGHGEHAHHNGCYFCDTQDLKKGHGIVDWQYTYCCNPFVGAAWAHGGGDATAYRMCHNCNSWDFSKGDGYDKSSLFDKLGHPAKSKLQPGDVLCADSHVALYIGDGKIAEAGHGDDNVRNSKSWNSSIQVCTLTDDRYSEFSRIYRYNASVSADRPLMHGEVSDRVADLQRFLVWYGIAVSVDGIFGQGTFDAVKRFQKDDGLTPDGIVGEKTIAKMKEIKK